MIDVEKTFEKFDSECGSFGAMENKLSTRPDLCAFMLLDKLLPEVGRDMVCGAEHDEIFLDVDCGQLGEVATEEDILALVRCGVRYDGENDLLAMFV